VARKVEVRLIDDLDNGPAAETVEFGLDGRDYTIDLSSKHAAELRGALERYIEAGVKQSRARVPAQRVNGSAGTRHPRSTRGQREQNEAIRHWARRKGLQVADRGRIAQDIVDEFQRAGGMSGAAAEPEPDPTPARRGRPPAKAASSGPGRNARARRSTASVG
jgi:hypothetical protein